jgi:hypothetical protein
MSMSWSEQIDTFRTTTSAPSTVSKHCFKWKEVGSDPTSTGTEKERTSRGKLVPKTKKKKVPAQDPISTKNRLKWEEVGSDQTSTGTEIKNEIPAGALLENVSEKNVDIKQEEWDKFRWVLAAQDPISTKYLVREMKPIAWPFQASSTFCQLLGLFKPSSPRTSLRPEDRVLCRSKLGGPDAKQWLGECEIISTISGNSGEYRVKWLWHENTYFDIKSEHSLIDEKDIIYMLVKNGTCLHQDPKWRSALEIVVRSPLYPPSSRPPPSNLSSPGRKVY